MANYQTTSFKLRPELREKIDKLIELNCFDNRSQAINFTIEHFLVEPREIIEGIEEFKKWTEEFNFGR